MKETDKAYLGGLISGEGCIWLRPRHSPKIVVGSIDKDLVQSVQDITGLGSVGIGSTKKGYRDGWQWQLYGKENIKNFLVPLLPWIKESSKHLQALCMIAYCMTGSRKKEIDTIFRKELAEQITSLKYI